MKLLLVIAATVLLYVIQKRICIWMIKKAAKTKSEGKKHYPIYMLGFYIVVLLGSISLLVALVAISRPELLPYIKHVFVPMY